MLVSAIIVGSVLGFAVACLQVFAFGASIAAGIASYFAIAALLTTLAIVALYFRTEDDNLAILSYDPEDDWEAIVEQEEWRDAENEAVQDSKTPTKFYGAPNRY